MIISGLKNTLRTIPRQNKLNFLKIQQSHLQKLQQCRYFSQQNQNEEKHNEQQKEQEEIQKIIQEQIKEQEQFFIPAKEIDELRDKKQIEKAKKYNVFDPKNHEETSLVENDETRLPLSVQERRQTVQVYEIFKLKAQWGEFYRVYGMALFLLGGFFLIVPFYNVVCQTFGFTMKQHAIEYGKYKDSEINVHRKFRINFMAHAQDEIPWEFEPQTATLVVNAGETSLAFYRAYNRSDKPVAGIAVYQIFPDECALYFNKIQCFCFENQLLYPKESVDLPLLFYLDPAINYDKILFDTQDIILTYHFFPSADQSIAVVLQKEIEKQQEEQKKLQEKREELKKRGIILEENKNPMYVAPGHNPKETPEMFIKKVQVNQARINKSIEIYEQKAKEGKLNDTITENKDNVVMVSTENKKQNSNDEIKRVSTEELRNAIA
eukprot:403361410